MYKKKFEKYCEKIKYIELQQTGGATSREDYIFSLFPPKYPPQLNDNLGSDSWFYCPVIWMALDRRFDEIDHSNVRRNQILSNIGRTDDNNIRFFGNIEQGWYDVIMAYDTNSNKDLLIKFNNLINGGKDFFKSYSDSDIEKILLMKTQDENNNSWHIAANLQINFIQRFSTDSQFFMNPRENFGIPLKNFLLDMKSSVSQREKIAQSSMPNQQEPLSQSLQQLKLAHQENDDNNDNDQQQSSRVLVQISPRRHLQSLEYDNQFELNVKQLIKIGINRDKAILGLQLSNNDYNQAFGMITKNIIHRPN